MKNVVGSIMSSLLVIAAIVIAIMVFVPYVVSAQTTDTTSQSSTDSATKNSVCEGIGLAGGGNGCVETEGSSINNLIANVVNLLSFIVGVVAVIMIIIGGLKYVTSSGDSNNVNSAKNTIFYAIIGLVVVALAQVIVRFVINTTNKVTPESGSITRKLV